VQRQKREYVHVLMCMHFPHVRSGTARARAREALSTHEHVKRPSAEYKHMLLLSAPPFVFARFAAVGVPVFACVLLGVHIGSC